MTDVHKILISFYFIFCLKELFVTVNFDHSGYAVVSFWQFCLGEFLS